MFIIISLILCLIFISLGIIIPLLNKLPWYCSLIFGIVGFLVGFVISVLILIFSFAAIGPKFNRTYDPKDKKRWRFMNWGSDYVLFWMNTHLYVKGLEKLDKNKTYVFYSNHQSFYDILVFDKVLRDFPRASLYKKEYTKNMFLSGIVSALGGVPLDRSDTRHAIDSINLSIGEVKSGVNFMIYPEGTRSHDGVVKKYHSGSFKIGKNGGTDLVIIAIDGLYKWYNIIPFIPKKFYIEIVDVIKKEDIVNLSTNELADITYNKTVEAINNARNKYRFLK